MKKSVIALAATAASLLSTGAMAQAYVSGAVGAGHVNLDCAGATACDSDDVALKLTGGYSFGNGFSAELGYISFGKAKASDSTARLEAKGDAVTLGVAYQLQLNDDWGMNFRLGAASVKASISATLDGVGSGTDSETNTAAYYGLGVNYAVTKNTKVEAVVDFSRAEYAGEKFDLRAITVGVRYDF